MDDNNKNNNDIYDRTYFGSPGCMLILIICIIVFFTFKDYLGF